MNRYLTALFAVIVLVAPASSFAADAGSLDQDFVTQPTPESDVDLVIELGIGGSVGTKYEGSDDILFSPMPIIDFDYLRLPGLFDIGSLEPEDGGFSFGPAFEFSGERKASDFDDLEGLEDVDATYQAGLGIGYEWRNAEIFGEARYAFGGAEGFVGEFGAKAILRPVETLELRAGPFATLASADYMDTYFGVTPEEAANTGFRLAAHDASGGFKSVGVSGTARYEFRPDWFLNADASYSRLVGDAGDSPIVDVGSEDQFTFGLGISKRFRLDLF